jgi:hypothetical protein
MPILAENKHRYPKDWKLRSRFVRLYRAKNRCEWCGCENYQPHPVTNSRVVLTVAHVFDDRPEASGLLNLAALCQRCHNRHDAPDRARRRKERMALAGGQMQLPLANVLAHPRRDGSPKIKQDACRRRMERLVGFFDFYSKRQK